MELKPGYKQTEVGVIPADWKLSRLGDLTRIYDGTHQTPKYVLDGIPFYSVEHVTSGDFTNTKFISNEEHRFLTRSYRIEQGDVLMTRIGSIGDCRLVDWDVNASFYVSLALLKVHGACPGFIAQYSNSRTFKAEAELHSLPSATPKKINLGAISDIRLPVPPIAEQQAITKALSEVDALLDSLAGLLAKKRSIKQAAMQELLTGKRRLPGFEGEWAQVSLGSVAAMNSGGTPPTGRDDFYGGGIPWVSISDMTSSGRFISDTERTLSDLGFANCSAKLFPSGTVLYAMYASLGECSIAAREVTTSQAILGIRPGSSLVGEYLYYWLESIRGAVKLMGQQGTQSNLNKKIVQGFSLGLPSKPEQAAIAKVLSEIDQDIDALKDKAEKTQTMKAGMMQQLLTGKIRLT